MPVRADILSDRPGEVQLALTVGGFATFGLHKIYQFDGRPRCACGGRSGCPGPAKHPSETWAHLTEPDFDAAYGRALYRPLVGYGVRTGRPSGLTVIDIDGAVGEASFSTLEAELGPLPDSWTVTTGRAGGGRHLWFNLPTDAEEPRTCAGVLAPGIDVRGRGGMVVGPGSPHRSGARYRWAPGLSPLDVELAPIPAAWAAALPLAGDKSAPAVRRSTGSRTMRSPASARPGHATGRRIGDGPPEQGFGGFNRPIISAACRWWAAAGTDADAERLIDALVLAVANAPKDPTLDRRRYQERSYLAEQVENARQFIISKQEPQP